jgi:ABC-type Fe3+ transport system substrate-binding protein
LTEQEIALLDSYQGWTDPRWKGRAAIINPSGFGYRFGLSYWVFQDPNLGEPWLRKLADLDPTVYSSANNAAPQVIAGEKDVVFNGVQGQGVRAYNDGAPYECKAAEYAPYYVWLAAIAKDAPHPAAAKLFVNWLYTENGQQATQDTWAYNALRDGFDKPLIDAEWWHVPEDQRLSDENLTAKNYDQLVQMFNSMFGAAKD